MKNILWITTSLILTYIMIVGGLYFSQEALIFMSTELPEDYQYTFETPFEEITLEAEDSAKLNALYFKQDDPKGLIVYFHGNAGDLSRWGSMVSPLVKHQYEVLIMDYRGYGKSKGNRTSRLMYHDATLIYQEAKRRMPEEKIILYGRSLGCAFASYLAAKNTPRKLILETPFYSLKDLVSNKYPWLPAARLLKFHFPNHQYIREVECPVSIFHGTADDVVPYENGFQLYQEANNAQMISISGGKHNNLSDFEKYQKELTEVLE